MPAIPLLAIGKIVGGAILDRVKKKPKEQAAPKPRFVELLVSHAVRTLLVGKDSQGNPSLLAMSGGHKLGDLLAWSVPPGKHEDLIQRELAKALRVAASRLEKRS